MVSTVYSNVLKTYMQVEIIRVLISRHQISVEQIAVLTPYSAQKNVIEDKLHKARLKVKVASITDSQGEFLSTAH